MSDSSPPTEVSLYTYAAPTTTVVVAVMILVVAAVTDLHDWGDGLASAIGAGLGVSAVFAFSGPGRRSIKALDGIMDPEDVHVRGTTRSLVVVVTTYVAFGVLVALWVEDVSTYGLVALIVGLAGLFDVRAVRDWEREHGLRLAWCHRTRRAAVLHPFRSQRSVGIRDPRYEEPAPPGH
jgi:hypothetical protein